MLRGFPLGCNSVLQECCEPQRARDTREAEDKKWEDGPAKNDSRREKKRDRTHSPPRKSAIRQRLRATLGKNLIKCTHYRKDTEDAPMKGGEGTPTQKQMAGRNKVVLVRKMENNERRAKLLQV